MTSKNNTFQNLCRSSLRNLIDNKSFLFSLLRKRCFFVLDLKTGGDLRYYLRKRYVFEECDVAFYIAAISSALDHIHSKNIIHRDVKPGMYELALYSIS